MTWDAVSVSPLQNLQILSASPFTSPTCLFLWSCPVSALIVLLIDSLLSLVISPLLFRFISGKKMAVCLASVRFFHLLAHHAMVVCLICLLTSGLGRGTIGSGPYSLNCVPFFASSSAYSFPWYPTCAFIHLIVIFTCPVSTMPFSLFLSCLIDLSVVTSESRALTSAWLYESISRFSVLSSIISSPCMTA